MRALATIGVLAVTSVAMAGPSWGQVRGDFNGDGYVDLVIGVPSENSGKALHVIYGSYVGLDAAGVGEAPAAQLWVQSSPGVQFTWQPGDRFGAAFGGVSP